MSKKIWKVALEEARIAKEEQRDQIKRSLAAKPPPKERLELESQLAVLEMQLQAATYEADFAMTGFARHRYFDLLKELNWDR